ncbi:MAG: hypothetical protein ACK5N8_06610 [Alphaproteobacteria bacterium]
MSMTLEINGNEVKVFDLTCCEVKKQKRGVSIQGSDSYSATFNFFSKKELSSYEKEVIGRFIEGFVRNFDKEQPNNE